jgi:DNA-binding protein YbaB
MPRPAGERPVQRPDWSALNSVIDDLGNALTGLDGLQERMRRLTGTGHSADGLVRAVVGPRGQLVVLDIDARVYRVPDARALAAAVLEATRHAVDDVTGQGKDLVTRMLPKDLRPTSATGPDTEALLYGHDADLVDHDNPGEAGGG